MTICVVLVLAAQLDNLFNYTRAAPCPEFTDLYGPPGVAIDENNWQWETTDDSTRMVNFYYCVMYSHGGTVLQHFRGFQATYDSDSGTVVQLFGQINAPGDFCESVDIAEEIKYATIYSDSNDTEGMVFDGHLGAVYTFRANGDDASPTFRMGGRPIGFKVNEGYGGTQTYDQPLQIAIAYNACNCPASAFVDDTAPPNDMETWAVSGPADVEPLPYYDNYMEMIYDQNCGTYTVEIEPPYPFLTVQKAGSLGTSQWQHPYYDQITASSNNVDDIGKYLVTLRITQSGPTDGYSQPSAGKMADITKSFSVIVNPCLETLQAGGQVGDMSYTIGNPTMTSDQYSWNQVCGYAVTVEITNLPEFAIHDEAAQTFTIYKIQDREHAGSYTVNIRGYINEPVDYTFSSYTTREVTYSFNIDMIDPCTTTVLGNPSASPMSISVMGLYQEQLLTMGTDTISLTLGDQTGLTYCGERTFSIQGVSPATPAHSGFLTLDATTGSIVAQTNDPSHVGTYTVTVQNTLTEFPTQITATAFTLTIDHCQVLNLTPTPTASQLYIVYTPMISFSYIDFVQYPICGYALDYTFRLINQSTGVATALPAWITRSGFNFDVYNTDPSTVGAWIIEVTGSVPTAYMNPVYSEQLLIELIVTNDCELDQVFPNGSISSMLYKIGEDGLVQLSPTWTVTRSTNVGPVCPSTYEISRVVSGVEQALTAHELAALTVAAYQSTGSSIDLQTSDFALDGETWTLKVYMRATYSTQPEQEGVYAFDIEFRDGCWASTLTPSQPNEAHSQNPTDSYHAGPPYTFDLWEYSLIKFSEMQNAEYGIGCGGFTYELEYLSGPLIGTSVVHTNTYTVGGVADYAVGESMTGTPMEMEWLGATIYDSGTHQYRLSCTNGETLTNRGVNGLFNTVYSDPFEVTIVNPCLTSIVNNDKAFALADMVVPVGNTQEVSATYSRPSDSTSIKYGVTGYDRCEEVRYDVLNDGGQRIEHRFLDLAVGTDPSQPDGLALTLFSEAEGQTIRKDIIIEVSLRQYPTATPDYIPFKVTYRECKPDALSVGPIEDQLYVIGYNQTSLIYDFNQFPCAYAANFTAFLIDGGKEKEIPDFITQDFNAPTMAYFTDNEAHVGKYDIKVYLGLDSEVGNVAYTNFTLIVKPVAERVSPNRIEEPRPPLLDLQDQTVSYPENLLYNIGEFDTAWGDPMEVTVDLGIAADFVKWDETTNSFKVAAGSYSKDQCGSYEICVQISFTNATYYERYSDCFVLDIECGEEEEQKLFEPVYKNVTDLKVRNGTLELGEYNPDQPIPYIKDLSPTGILIIGWDRLMTEPEDYAAINPTQVGIRDSDAKVANRTQDVDPIIHSTTNDLSIDSLAPDDGRRRHLERGYQWFANERDQLEWLLVVDALELKLQPGANSDPQVLKLTWKMLDYSKENIQIQLYFAYPPRVSEHIEFDTLEVYFWGTEYFRSWQGEDVRFGTKLTRPIVRQIDPELAEWLGVLGHAAKILSSSIVMVVVTITGRLLPTWMFINSLQLILHTHLFQTYMPALVAFFFSQMLDVARFNVFPDWEWLHHEYGHLDQGGHSTNFKYYGYKSLYLASNLNYTSVYAFLIVGMWLLALLKDTVRCFSYARIRNIFMLYRHEPWMFNFGCRFFYEVFLELVLCALISIAHPKDDYNVAVAILIACGVFMVYVIALQRSFLLRYHRNEMSNGRFVISSAVNQQGILGQIWKQADLIQEAKKQQPVEQSHEPEPSNKHEPEVSYEKEQDPPELLIESITDSQCSESPWIANQQEKQRKQVVPKAETQFQVFKEKTAKTATSKRSTGTFTLDGLRAGANGRDSALRQSPAAKLHKMTLNSNMKRQETSSSWMNPEHKRAKKPDLQFYEGGEANRPHLEVEPMKDGQMLRYFRRKRTRTKKDDKPENVDRYRTLAEWRVAVEYEMQKERVEIEPRYKTFFYGHRLFSNSNAILHSVLFLFRRAIYALCLVYCEENASFGIFFLMLSSLLMLALLWRDGYWFDDLIVLQHVMNEVTLYAMCIMLLLLTVDRYAGLRHPTTKGYVELQSDGFYAHSEHRDHVFEQLYHGTELDRVERAGAIYKVSHEQIYWTGVSMVVLLVINIIFNFSVIIFDAYKHLKLFWIRRNQIMAHRRTRISQHKVTQITYEANRRQKQMLQNFPCRPKGQDIESEEFDIGTKAFMKDDEKAAQELQFRESKESNMTQNLRSTTESFVTKEKQAVTQYLQVPNASDQLKAGNRHSKSRRKPKHYDLTPVKTITTIYHGKVNQIETRSHQIGTQPHSVKQEGDEGFNMYKKPKNAVQQQHLNIQENEGVQENGGVDSGQHTLQKRTKANASHHAALGPYSKVPADTPYKYSGSNFSSSKYYPSSSSASAPLSHHPERTDPRHLNRRSEY